MLKNRKMVFAQISAAACPQFVAKTQFEQVHEQIVKNQSRRAVGVHPPVPFAQRLDRTLFKRIFAVKQRKPGDKRLGQQTAVVLLNFFHVAHRKTLFFAQQLLDARRPPAWVKFDPQKMGVIVADNLLVGHDDQP